MTQKIIAGLPSGESFYAGYDDLVFQSPDHTHTVVADYVGEAPHGDSYHSLKVDGVNFPGLAWSGLFAWSDDSRYFCGSWMKFKFERSTLVVDCELKRFFVLPEYFSDFQISWPEIIEIDEETENRARLFQFSGHEVWSEASSPLSAFQEVQDGPLLSEWYKKLIEFYLSKGLTLELANNNVNTVRKSMSALPEAQQLMGLKQIMGMR